MVFFIFSEKKLPIFIKTVTRLDLTDGMNEWRETNTLQLNMTHKHEHEKKKRITGNKNRYKNVKKSILNLKLFSGNTVQNK